MGKEFSELAGRIKARWGDDSRRVYEAASAEFVTEVKDRAELGIAIAASRKARGLTQPELSQMTGIQQAEISRIERGVGNPTAATLLRLAEALGQRLALLPGSR